MTAPVAAATPPAPLGEREIARLQALLDAAPPPLQPPDVSALDGLLCGVLLQPRPVPAARWLPWVADLQGRDAPPGPWRDELQALAMRRHAELDRAIGARDWFDPWVFEVEPEAGEGDGDGGVDGDADVPEPEPWRLALLPWVAGFAAAMDAFPALMALPDPALAEPMALLYQVFDPDDLEDADELLALIETLEPPPDLAEAVQDLVRALMLIADVSRPRAAPPQAARAAARRPRPGAGRPRGTGRR
jgi:uncharacterized protein